MTKIRETCLGNARAWNGFRHICTMVVQGALHVSTSCEYFLHHASSVISQVKQGLLFYVVPHLSSAIAWKRVTLLYLARQFLNLVTFLRIRCADCRGPPRLCPAPPGKISSKYAVRRLWGQWRCCSWFQVTDMSMNAGRSWERDGAVLLIGIYLLIWKLHVYKSRFYDGVCSKIALVIGFSTLLDTERCWISLAF